MELIEGQKFHDLSVQEFQQLNKEANNIGLVSRVTLIEETTDGKLITLELIKKRS